jgi:hypothetical protein
VFIVTVFRKSANRSSGLLTAGHDVPAVEAVMDRYLADDFYNKIGFDAAGFAKPFNRLNSAAELVLAGRTLNAGKQEVASGIKNPPRKLPPRCKYEFL